MLWVTYETVYNEFHWIWFSTDSRSFRSSSLVVERWNQIVCFVGWTIRFLFEMNFWKDLLLVKRGVASSIHKIGCLDNDFSAANCYCCCSRMFVQPLIVSSVATWCANLQGSSGVSCNCRNQALDKISHFLRHSDSIQTMPYLSFFAWLSSRTDRCQRVPCIRLSSPRWLFGTGSRHCTTDSRGILKPKRRNISKLGDVLRHFVYSVLTQNECPSHRISN